MTEHTRLGEVADIDVGLPFSSADFTSIAEDIRLLRGDNIAQGKLAWEGAARWPVALAVDSRYKMRSGDVVLAMDRPWISAGLKRSRLRDSDVPSYLVQRVARLRARDGLDQGFLGYIVDSQPFSDYLVSVQTGTAIPHISARQISNFTFALPELRTQHAIAEVLSALDDKITSNTHVASTAEQFLRAEMDAEWLQHSDRGALLSDFVVLNPSVPVPPEDKPLYVDMKKLPETGWSIDEPDRREAKGGARFQRGDTLLARITPCLENRKTGYVDNIRTGQTAIGSTEFIVLRAREGIASPIAFLLATESRFRDFAIQHMAGTSGRQRVAAADLARFELPKPDALWLADFGARATALFAHVESLQEENRTLAATRDALLPQLMSGRLRVRDAEAAASAIGI